VQPAGTIRLLNESWRVPKALVGHYVWATITTQRHTLDIWFRRDRTHDWRLIKHVHYEIAEPIHKREPCFARLFAMS
jgi:hypothetical protein